MACCLTFSLLYFYLQVTRKVVSMVTEINYADSTGRVDFDSREFLEIKYSVQVNFLVYQKSINKQ